MLFISELFNRLKAKIKVRQIGKQKWHQKTVEKSDRIILGIFGVYRMKIIMQSVR
jgi:hypothetical protein